MFPKLNILAVFLLVLFGVNITTAQNAQFSKNNKEPVQINAADEEVILLMQKANTGLKKNGIYGTLGTTLNFGAANLNYERMIIGNQNGFFTSYWVRVGYGGYYNWDEKGRIFNLGLTALSGNGKNHFEIGGGITSFADRTGYLIDRKGDQSVKRSSYHTIYPAGSLGYRFQNSNGGSFFRAGIAFPEALYVSLGYRF